MVLEDPRARGADFLIAFSAVFRATGDMVRFEIWDERVPPGEDSATGIWASTQLAEDARELEACRGLRDFLVARGAGDAAQINERIADLEILLGD